MKDTNGNIVPEASKGIQTTNVWPLANLQIHIGSLILKLPTPLELTELAQVAQGGVHDPEEMPFSVPWSVGSAEEIGLRVLQFHWRCCAEFKPECWTADFVVVHEGAVIGTQAISGNRFNISKTVSTGSWIGAKYHGHGFGTLARLAVLSLAFEHQGALTAKTGWNKGNIASARVSEKIGYKITGTDTIVVQDRRSTLTSATITTADWHAIERPHAVVEGFDACRSLFGIKD